MHQSGARSGESFLASMLVTMTAITRAIVTITIVDPTIIPTTYSDKTGSSAIAEGPRDASCQLKIANCHATVQKLLVRQVLNKSKLLS